MTAVHDDLTVSPDQTPGAVKHAPDTLVKLSAEHFASGAPLRADVVDARGFLLLRRGTVASGHQLERMLEPGLFCAEADFAVFEAEVAAEPDTLLPELVTTSTWERLTNLCESLGPTLDDIVAGEQGVEPIEDMARELHTLCELDADAMLASLFLLKGRRYSVRQTVNVAIVVELMSRLERFDDEQRLSLVRAALTMNLGMLALQDELFSQSDPLTAAQRMAVAEHPLRGAATLREAGVSDALWLRSVARHHEHADGTGYPKRLRAPELGVPAQLIMVADRYCAMVSDRAYRRGAPPDRALAMIVEKIGSNADAKIPKLLKAVVGDFPPGCAVRLANREVGIVMRRTRSTDCKVVKSLRSTRGAVYDDGPRRLTNLSQFEIVQAIPLADLALDVDPRRIWGEAVSVAESGR